VNADKTYRVTVIEKSFVARLASGFLKSPNAAIVFGSNIYVWGVSKEAFLVNRRWLLHELQHVAQYHRDGYTGFIGRYILNHIKYGYHNNPYEVEARAAEQNENLLKQFQLL